MTAPGGSSAAGGADATISAPDAAASGRAAPQGLSELGLDPEIVNEFVIEGTELLADADTRLLQLEKNPLDVESINAVFRAFHTIKGLAGFLNLEEMQNTAHAAEDLLDRARSRAEGLHGKAIDLVFQATDVLRQLIQRVGACVDQGNWPPAQLGGVAPLVEKIRQSIDESIALAALPPTRGPAGAVQEELAEPDAEAAPGALVRDADRTVRVDAERLDQLVDLTGELVITESMVNRAAHAGESDHRELRRLMQRLDKITHQLQELASSLRMVPVQGLFRKMARLARDTAHKCQKQVTFEASGEDTELDKTVVEKVADPLVHLVRNAIDHGLEGSSAQRVKSGKPPAGRIHLRAFHRGGYIFIEVEDDGRGLDRDAIVRKALERGLIRADTVPDERDILNLICQPGFSTAAQVTALSGRGVGMDVVKRNIVAMGGSLEIRSEPGQGTCFGMRLPLTLAVIDGMLVRAGTQRYVIPTLSVLRLIEPKAADISSVLGQLQLLEVQGQRLPLLELTTLFRVPASEQAPQLAIVAEADGERVAILVDALLGQQQAVIKSLGQGLGDTPGLSGCAILSDGRVGLVVDIAGLLQLARGTRGGSSPDGNSPGDNSPGDHAPEGLQPGAAAAAAAE
ncbi:MAG: hypothetical protein RL033_6843 [Pseudomonadota bacterium]